MPQLIGRWICRRVVRNNQRILLQTECLTSSNTVSSRCSPCGANFTSTFFIVVLGTYRSEDLPLVSSRAGDPHPNYPSTTGTRLSRVETLDEQYELVHKCLDQNSPSFPIVVPPKKRKGFGYYLNQIPAMFKLKSRH
jgi:hypothetical protein